MAPTRAARRQSPTASIRRRKSSDPTAGHNGALSHCGAEVGGWSVYRWCRNLLAAPINAVSRVDAVNRGLRCVMPQCTGPGFIRSTFPFIALEKSQVRHRVGGDEFVLVGGQFGLAQQPPPGAGIEIDLVQQTPVRMAGIKRN